MSDRARASGRGKHDAQLVACVINWARGSGHRRQALENKKVASEKVGAMLGRDD